MYSLSTKRSVTSSCINMVKIESNGSKDATTTLHNCCSCFQQLVYTYCRLRVNNSYIPVCRSHDDRAYFSVQYCTLCAVLTEKCAVLNAKMCSIEI